MEITMLKKLKVGDSFRRVLFRDGDLYLSSEVYCFDGYDKLFDFYCYCYDDEHNYFCKDGLLVVVKEQDYE